MENKLIRTNEGTNELVAIGGGGGRIITGMDVNDSPNKLGGVGKTLRGRCNMVVILRLCGLQQYLLKINYIYIFCF